MIMRTPTFRPLTIPPEVALGVHLGAYVALNHSGGKDSQAMEAVICDWLRREGLLHRAFSIHCDLGRAEWAYSLPQCRKTSSTQGISCVEVRPPNGDLLDYLARKAAATQGTGRPFWPDANNRWCTSLKREACDKHFRRYPLIISCEGLRAEESPDRAKKRPLTMRKRITATALRDLSMTDALNQRQDGQRVALTWLPIHEWSERDVWLACGTSLDEVNERRGLWQAGKQRDALRDWPAHQVYVMGNHRASCAICVLANQNDLRNGVQHNPETASFYVNLEQQTGCTFRHGHSLSSLVNTVDDHG